MCIDPFSAHLRPSLFCTFNTGTAKISEGFIMKAVNPTTHLSSNPRSGRQADRQAMSDWARKKPPNPRSLFDSVKLHGRIGAGKKSRQVGVQCEVGNIMGRKRLGRILY